MPHSLPTISESLEVEKATLLPSYAPQRGAGIPIVVTLRVQKAIGIETEYVRIATAFNHTRPIVRVAAYVTRATIPGAIIYEIGRSVLDITASASS